MRTDGRLQDWRIGPSVNPTWNSGESFGIDYRFGFTRLDEDAAIGGVTVPAGDYDTWSLGLRGSTSSNRPVVLSGNARYQSIYDGDITTVRGSVTLIPNANISTVVAYTHNRIDLPNGSLDADIGSVRLAVALTTQFTVDALIQYNQADDALSANVRFNFIHTPGSDLVLVINEQRGTSDSIWDLRTRSTVAKITYLARI